MEESVRMTEGSGGSALGPGRAGGRGAQSTPKSWQDPKFSRPRNLAVVLTHRGQLILGKISKLDATRCQILRLKCTYSISAGAPLQTPLGKLAALPQTRSCI